MKIILEILIGCIELPIDIALSPLAAITKGIRYAINKEKYFLYEINKYEKRLEDHLYLQRKFNKGGN